MRKHRVTEILLIPRSLDPSIPRLGEWVVATPAASIVCEKRADPLAVGGFGFGGVRHGC